MARLLLATFLAGLAITLLAAGFLPLPEHPRIHSQINVVTGGGRQEDFIIRWPQDRISVPETRASDTPSGTIGAMVLRTPSGELAGAELFRLRDVDGNVIGIASRVTARVTGQRVPSASVTNWMMLIPSRGGLLLSQENSADVGPVWSTADGGRYVAPAEGANFWSRGSRYRITAGPARDGQGKVVRGTGEFQALEGTYTEIWELEEVGADGKTEGRIAISTVTRGAR